MIDIKSLGPDVKKDNDGDKYKAINLLSVQLQDKNYAPDFGVDLDFFINSDYQISPVTFVTHLMKRLTDHSISVKQVQNQIDDFIADVAINIEDK